MNHTVKVIHPLAIFSLFSAVWASDAWSHGESGSAQIGPNFAVQAEKHGVGFKLSPESIQFMGIRFTPWNGGKVPASAWVSALEGVSLYVSRDGWIQRLDLTPSSRKSGTVPAGTLHSGDQLVTAGVAAVRGADLEISSSEAEEEENEHEGEDEHDHESHKEGHEDKRS